MGSPHPSPLPMAQMLDAVDSAVPLKVRGRVSAMAGLTIEAEGLPLPVGALVTIETMSGRQHEAEVVGFKNGRALLMPITGTSGISAGDRVTNKKGGSQVPVGEALLGRVLDGAGRPIDDGPSLPRGQMRRIDTPPPPPLARRSISEPISTGTRAIDALLTCGRGQRVGLFAAPGVGKSTLMSSIAKATDADVIVIALIGERGREVQDFLHNTLGEDGLRRCVVIVATGDDPPLMKVRAATVACTVAESFRDRGGNVLLLMDSLTRLAQAQRQVGLAAGEPPATRGFPPSVFALLPQILERAGRTAEGSVTGFYTVLVEGNDFDEPIPDAIKGIADGHVLLSRELAEKNHWPAIDVLRSISRARSDVTDKLHRAKADRILRLEGVYRDLADLISVGAYVPGSDPEQDVAVAMHKEIEAFLQQGEDERATLASSVQQLDMLIAKADLAQQQLASAQQQTAQ